MKTFDDVLIAPKFSEIKSRQNVDLTTQIGTYNLKLPVFSANMDTVTGTKMAITIAESGGMGVLHRFYPLHENVVAFEQVITHAARPVAVSVGVGEEEIKRAVLLAEVGADMFFLDVAHGAQQRVVDQYNELKATLSPNANIIVGNFATPDSIAEFLKRCVSPPTAIKIGIGPGSACTTRIKTGVGVPQLDAIRACNKIYSGIEVPLIADGGLRTAGDIAKALAAGADAVMIGGMLSGTDETPGIILDGNVKQYRGSASESSYDKQNKTAGWRTAEGAEFYVPCKGPAKKVFNDINGGLRSAFTYVGAKNLKEFQDKAQFINVTNAGRQESVAHGDNNGNRR